ncbi:MAG: SMI1/KNR4 family protein [Micropepsaceae bacterium]
MIDDLTKLRMAKRGFAVFEDRLIYDAQPPVDDATLAKIEAKCAGPLPEGLKALWRTAFGGSLDYALEIELGDQIVEFSFTELFYPDSGGYHDLWGWIDHEVGLAGQAAQESGATFDGRLRYLPFGGFEYLDRLYVCVEPGPRHGSVLAWMQGLPPAWVLRLNQDSAGTIAGDVPSLFRLLDLNEDPFADGVSDIATGTQVAGEIAELAREDAALAASLKQIVQGSVVDWRAAAASGSLARSPRLLRLAILDACERGDRDALARLEASGCNIKAQLRSGGSALDFALAQGHSALAEWLITRRFDVTNAVRNGASKSPPDLVRRLLKAGAKADPIAARSAALAGLHESAVLIAGALSNADRRALVDGLDPEKAGADGPAVKALRDACLKMRSGWFGR